MTATPIQEEHFFSKYGSEKGDSNEEPEIGSFINMKH